jgi:hypothetical protein
VRLKLARADWISTNHTPLTDAITELLDQAARLDLLPHPSDDPAATEPDEDPDDDAAAQQPRPQQDNGDDTPGHETRSSEENLGDYLHWLAQDLTDDELDPGTLANLGLALGELRTQQTVTAQQPHHGIHKAIRHAERLRAGFNQIGTSRPTAKAEN